MKRGRYPQPRNYSRSAGNPDPVPKFNVPRSKAQTDHKAISRSHSSQEIGVSKTPETSAERRLYHPPDIKSMDLVSTMKAGN